MTAQNQHGNDSDKRAQYSEAGLLVVNWFVVGVVSLVSIVFDSERFRR